MTQYYARTDVSYSGGDKLFSITFPYIKKEHIKVFVNGELTDNYTYITASQIRIDDELELDDEISIRRTTPIDERMVVFSDTSILNKDAQNLDSDQLFDVVQEIYDNNTSFKFDTTEQIENIEAKADTALSNAAEAISIANTAETKADNAISTANTASTNADTAVSIANSANTSAQSAVSTAESAVSTAESAVSTANDAKDIAEGAESVALSSKERVDEFDASITAVLDAAEQIEELQSAIDDAIEAAEAAQETASSLVIDDELDDTSEQPVQNKVIKAALDDKQDTLVSGTNIKTVGNQSLVGAGNVDIKTVDNQSIIGAGNVDIQSIIEQNSNEKTKLWMGTYAQYLAINGAVAIKYYLEVPNALECYIIPSTIDTTTPHSTTIYNADGTVMSLSGYQGIYNLYKYINTDNNSEVWTTTLVDDSNNPFNNQLLNQISLNSWQRNLNITISSRPTANTIIASDGYTYSLTDEQYISQGANIYVLSQNSSNGAIRLYYQYPQYITIGDGDTSLYDDNTIYICTDTGSIYKGTTQIIVNGSDKVSKSGDTMSGDLKFQSDEIERSVTPAENLYTPYLNFTDKNGDNLANIYFRQSADGSKRFQIACRDNSNVPNSLLTLGYNANGDAYCYFPDTDRCDGQWALGYESVLSSTSLNGETDLVKTVTLPNDGNIYEVFLRIILVTGTTSGNAIRLYLTTNVFTNQIYACGAQTRSSSSITNVGSIIIPMRYGTGNLNIHRATSYNGTAAIGALGYRRLGKNA